MKKHSIETIQTELKQLVIDEYVTEEHAAASMRILQNFNQCMIGLSSFSGTTPWELHEDDEFLQVLNGTVDVLIFDTATKIKENLKAGDCLVVPKGLWHRQTSQDGAQILFITSLEGNQTSTDEFPPR